MLNRKRLNPKVLLTVGTIAAASILTTQAAAASPDQVELDGRQAHVSMYEARRGSEEVKVIVHNSSCAVKHVWLDE